MRKFNFDFISRWRLWFAGSLIVILIGLGFMATRGLNMGIDFVGGTSVLIEMGQEFDKADVDAIVRRYDANAVTQKVEDTQIELRSQSLDTATTADLVEELKTAYNLGENPVLEEELMGASISAELTRSGIIAVIIASLLMLAYISVRFRTNYALAAVIALVHDILITLSIYAILQIPLNTPFIAAILTILGYSINDTIVIFDRLRENLKQGRGSDPKGVANLSINQSMTRSINTLLTTLFTIVAVYVFVPAVRDFAFPITVGILAGGYSSIFIASPVWVYLENLTNAKRAAQRKVARSVYKKAK